MGLQVKRLFRADNEAVSVKLKFITEEELTSVVRQGRITLMPSLLSVEGLTMIQKILVLTCLTVMRRAEK